jgi:hypothetical protein
MLSMNSSILILAFATAVAVLAFVLFQLFLAAGRSSPGAERAQPRKLPRDWRRWLFGEHNIPFS